MSPTDDVVAQNPSPRSSSTLLSAAIGDSVYVADLRSSDGSLVATVKMLLFIQGLISLYGQAGVAAAIAARKNFLFGPYLRPNFGRYALWCLPLSTRGPEADTRTRVDTSGDTLPTYYKHPTPGWFTSPVGSGCGAQIWKDRQLQLVAQPDFSHQPWTVTGP
ncbi:hypothetical protein BDZ89DRAFT_1039019 [Hymenopellis radicata]|nr:hypothetical protein BDZ89DRAFT_1039019 [Hymenopellis radicata]